MAEGDRLEAMLREQFGRLSSQLETSNSINDARIKKIELSVEKLVTDISDMRSTDEQVSCAVKKFLDRYPLIIEDHIRIETLLDGCEKCDEFKSDYYAFKNRVSVSQAVMLVLIAVALASSTSAIEALPRLIPLL